MKNKEYGFNMPESKRDKVMDLLKHGEPLHNPEIVALTGATIWQVSQCRQWLQRNGYHIKRKKQKLSHLQFMVISGNSEADANKNRKNEENKKSKAAKAATALKNKLDEFAYQRKIAQINTVGIG